MMIQLDSRSLFFDAIEAIREEGLLGRISFDVGTLRIYPTDEDASEAVHSLLTDLDLLPTSGNHPNDDEHDPFRTDAEADGDALASAGLGTDEDYEHPGMDDDY